MLMCKQSLNYNFYFEFLVHVLMVKQCNIANEETFFSICMAGCAVIHTAVCKDFVLIYILHFIFGLVSNLRDHMRFK